MNSDIDLKRQQKIAARLKEAREKSKFTQAEVATKSDITINYYAMIERGEVNPTMSIMLRIIKVLNIKSFDLESFL